MLSCSVCGKEAHSKCSKCHIAAYCGTDCQRTDWKTHKRQCGKPLNLPPAIIASPEVYPTSYSPFGQMLNPLTGQSVPVSHNTIFFNDVFGYTVDNPEKTYMELVDAFRLQRLADERAGSGPTSAGFADYVAKVQASKMVPDWWKDDLHGPKLIEFSATDEWARLDRVVDEEQIIMHQAQAREQRPGAVKIGLQMMSERIWGTQFQPSELGTLFS